VKVRVQFFAAARELVGTREETIVLPEQATVKHLLDALVDRHGEPLRDYLIDSKTGKPRASIQFLIGDQPISGTGGMATQLSDGVVFAIIPPVGGG
jgi:MoaD family protein